MTAGGVSPVPREARSYQGKRAGLITRMVANVVDVAVVAVIIGVCYAGLNGLLFMVDPRGFSFVGWSLLASMTAAVVVAIPYLAGAWALTGRTYGCHVMGLRVLGRRGGRPSLPVALVRSVTCVLFPIGLLWCAWSTRQSSLQDLLVRTTVIYDWLPRAGPLPEGAAAEGTP
jgi:uncharacterized RDD family membrane protein YckC